MYENGAQHSAMQNMLTGPHKEFLLYDAKRMQDKMGNTWDQEVLQLKNVAQEAQKVSEACASLLKQHEVRTHLKKQPAGDRRKKSTKTTGRTTE